MKPSPDPIEPEGGADPRLARERPQVPRTWGVPMIIIGLTLLVARFALLPLQLEPRWLSAVFAGLSGALVVIGYGGVRRGAGPLRWGPAIAASLAGSAIVVSALGALRPAPLADVALEPFAHRAFTLDLPAWGAPDVSELGSQGRMERSVSAAGPTLNLSWSFGEGLPPEQMVDGIAGAMAGLGEVDIRWVEPVPVGEGQVRVAVIEVDEAGIATVMSAHQCSPTFGLVLAMTARGDAEPLVALHRRALATLRCVDGVAPSAPARVRWTAPTGFTLSFDDADGQGWERPRPGGGFEGVVFPPMHPDPKLAEGLAEHPAVLTGLLRMFVADPRPLPDPLPRPVDGVTRAMRAFAGADAQTGEPVELLFTIWPCPAVNATAIGFYLTDAGGAAADGVPLLTAARCPEGAPAGE